MSDISRTEKRTPAYSKSETTHLVRPADINGYGRLFGGILMQWIDEIAGVVAMRHSGKLVTTASVDNLDFKHPAYDGDMVVLTGRITHVGNTSMEVRVDTFVESLDGVRKEINRAYLVEVALDQDGTKAPVPGLILENEEDDAEWAAGEKRRALRKTRRQEGY